MNRASKFFLLAVGTPLLLLADLAPEAPLGIALGRDAAAIIGMPLSPLSFGGVARRTTRRVVYASAATTAAVATTAAATSAAAASAAAHPAPPPPPPPAAPAPEGPVPVGTVVSALPHGCAPISIGGTEYYNCAPGVYYRAAFQGNNLVYVSAKP